jgi:hypothetical protein
MLIGKMEKHVGDSLQINRFRYLATQPPPLLVS